MKSVLYTSHLYFKGKTNLRNLKEYKKFDSIHNEYILIKSINNHDLWVAARVSTGNPVVIRFFPTSEEFCEIFAKTVLSNKCDTFYDYISHNNTLCMIFEIDLSNINDIKKTILDTLVSDEDRCNELAEYLYPKIYCYYLNIKKILSSRFDLELMKKKMVLIKMCGLKNGGCVCVV